MDFGCVKYLSPESVAYLRSVFLYPGETDSVDFRRLLEKYYDDIGEKLLPGARHALIGFAENFYRKVYPPKPEKISSSISATPHSCETFCVNRRTFSEPKAC